MNKNTIKALFAVVALAQTSLAFAGAGANTRVCLNMPVAPYPPYKATVTVGNSSNSQCMNDYGVGAIIEVTKAGLNCAAVGYIEAKSSSTKGDFCADSKSYWQVSYKNDVDGGGASGSAQINLTTSNTSSNSASISNQQTSTYLCGSEGMCNGNSVNWPHGNVGHLFIMFSPGGK